MLFTLHYRASFEAVHLFKLDSKRSNIETYAIGFKYKLCAEYSCPARDPVNAAVREGYDPAAVNWGALVADIVAIGKQEPRFCNMAIRSWFHDLSGFSDGDEESFPFDGGADGSFITDFNETDQAEGALHGFGQFSRHVILQVWGLCFFACMHHMFQGAACMTSDMFASRPHTLPSMIQLL